jgi:hypothetical protein
MNNEDFIKEQRERILKRLKMTRQNETICLRDWEVEILIEWINELKGRKAHESVDTRRNSESG